MWLKRICVAALVLVSLSGINAQARITRLEVLRTELVFGSETFGNVGPYQHIFARAYGDLDPADPRNAIVQDLYLAPRNARGMVEYSTEVEFLQPADPHRGNGVKLFEVNNRGNKLAIAAFDVGVPLSVARRNALDAAGDGWLMRQGFTLVWWGWEMDAEPGWDRILMPEIVAHNTDGSAITGVVRSEIITPRLTTTVPISSASKSNPIHSTVTTATRPPASTAAHRRPTASCQA